MEQPRTAHGASQWYLIASHGDMVLRVRPGMPLGETAAGELSFDRSCAQLELDIAEDGGLMLSAFADHELESAGGLRCRSERLTRDRRAEIRLPHNVLQLVTDFVDPAEADETVEIRPRERTITPPTAAPTEFIPPAAALTELVAPKTTPTAPIPPKATPAEFIPPKAAPTELASTNTTLNEFIAPKATPTGLIPPKATPTELIPPKAAPTEFTSPNTTLNEFIAPKATPTGLTPPKATLIGRIRPKAALIGLAVFGLAVLYLLYPAPRDGVMRAPPPAVTAIPAPPQIASPQAPAAVAETAQGATNTTTQSQIPSAVPLPTPGRAVSTLPMIEPKQAAESAQRLPEPRPVAAPRVESGATPRVDDGPVPQVATATNRDEPIADSTAIGSQSSSPVAAEQSLRIDATGTRSLEPAAGRALNSADRAPAEREPTAPSEASAATLLPRFAAAPDPASAEAKRPPEPVPQDLINRALAELARGALSDARASLKAAADAGADSPLVDHLRDEIDYRERQLNTGAGSHE